MLFGCLRTGDYDITKDITNYTASLAQSGKFELESTSLFSTMLATRISLAVIGNVIFIIWLNCAAIGRIQRTIEY